MKIVTPATFWSTFRSDTKYKSKETKNDIIVDISIETTLPNVEEYSLLTIIECKNYSSSNIPVNDIREFRSILDEIGSSKTKGIMITNSKFASGVFEYAKANGIGLARINVEDKVDWINYRRDKPEYIHSIPNVKKNLYEDELVGKKFYAYYNDTGFVRFPDLLINLGVIDKYQNQIKYLNVPFLNEEMIQNRIEKIPEISTFYSGELDIIKFCEYLSDEYAIDFHLDKVLETGILGKIEFEPEKIFVSNFRAENEHRWRFTLAHEIGHFILHKEILAPYFSEKIDREDSLSYIVSEYSTHNKYLEIQANIFANRLLLPQKQLHRYVGYYFRKNNIYKGRLYLDDQRVNQVLVFTLLSELSNNFNISKSVAKFRLIQQGLLTDTTDVHILSLFKRK